MKLKNCVFAMLSEVDVFISNYTLVDPEIYQLWVDGHSCKFDKHGIFLSHKIIFICLIKYKYNSYDCPLLI